MSVCLVACGDQQATLTLDELRDPEACRTCHPVHVQEWEGSMHAYAANDPVFLAMNRRGQADTNGTLGSFCVKCHAPMAVELGLTTDGLNLESLPAWSKGVTCFYCHSVTAIEGEHNNPLRLATDGIMRGGLRAPAYTAAHASAYGKALDGGHRESSRACGACHDIVTPAGVHLERTFAEWRSSIFASRDPGVGLECARCHMFGQPGKIAETANAPVRVRREHTFAGVDTALTPWPEREAQRQAIDRDLKATLLARLCILPANGGELTVRLDNLGAGHAFPSGAAHDRRAWVEVQAFDRDGALVFASGVVPAQLDPEETADSALFGMWDRTYRADGAPAEFFWDVARYDSSLLTPRLTNDRTDPRFDHSTTKRFHLGSRYADIARATMVVKLRALPLRLLDRLGLGAVASELPTLELGGTKLEWTPSTAINRCVE